VPGFRHIEQGMIGRYSGSIHVNTYPSGERRIDGDPPRSLLEAAFQELGTRAAVAHAFGVSRDVVKRWVTGYQMTTVSRPEAALAANMKRRLSNEGDRRVVAQWIMDEGSISVAYFSRGDYTILIVCGSMNDYSVLALLSKILEVSITSSKSPSPTTLPMGAIRVQSARAYALLGELPPDLHGLKGQEARAALEFFPPSGLLRGRHTTDEFLLPAWKGFSMKTMFEWNSRRRVKTREDRLTQLADISVNARVRRARRFLDASQRSVAPKTGTMHSRL
jgi:hypothetical protein